MKQLIHLLIYSLLGLNTLFAQDLPNDIEYDSNGTAFAIKNSFIVRFNPNLLNNEVIDNLQIQEGVISDFINPEALSNLLIAGFFNEDLLSVPLKRVYTHLRSTDSVSIARDGFTPITIPKFYATFIIEWDNLFNLDYKIAKDSFEHFVGIVEWTDFNWIAKGFVIPNDPFYTSNNQKGVGFNPSSPPNVKHIFSDIAWDYSNGSNQFKVGVYDTGINQDHEDFIYAPNDNVISGGYNFIGKSPLKVASSNDNDGHGTALASIIGSVRNNSTGIAGIAGGDKLANKKGVQLFDMKIASDVSNYSYSAALNSIERGATSTGTNGYGLNLMNHSWGMNSFGSSLQDPKIHGLREVIDYACQNQVTIIAANGNMIGDGVAASQIEYYPAQYELNQVMRVAGWNLDGTLWGPNVLANIFRDLNREKGGVFAPAVNASYSAAKHTQNIYTDLLVMAHPFQQHS